MLFSARLCEETRRLEFGAHASIPNPPAIEDDDKPVETIYLFRPGDLNGNFLLLLYLAHRPRLEKT